jgi:hypothetical protein
VVAPTFWPFLAKVRPPFQSFALNMPYSMPY